MSRLVSRTWAAALLLIVAGATAVRAAELVFDIAIEHGRIAEPMRLMRVHQGDIVKLRWTSDRPVVLHLHGYDIERRVAAGAVAEFAFTATASGRFPIEIHAPGTPGATAGGHAHQDATLGIVEVHPR